MSNTIIQQTEEDSSDQFKPFSESMAVMSGLVIPEDVHRSLFWLTRPGETLEIRTFEPRTKGWAGISAGYFRDVKTATAALVDHVEEFDPGQCYVTLNPVIPALYARARDCIKTKQRHTTKDADILRYRNLLIDHDPVRPTGIPATDDELEASRKKMDVVKAFLGEAGFPHPLVGMSGNGYHLIYAFDLEVTDETRSLVQSFLEALAFRFDDARVKIDKAVHNPARISKIYGTFPRKGDDADDRVNRMARIIEYPQRVDVSRELLQGVIAKIGKDRPKPVAITKSSSSAGAADRSTSRPAGQVNLRRFLDNRSLGYRDGDGSKIILLRCPFNPDHNRGEVAVFQNASGSLGFNCFHNSCADRRWRDFIDVVGRVTKKDYDDHVSLSSRPTVTVGGSADRPDGSFLMYAGDRTAIEKSFPTEALPDGLRQFVVEVAKKTNAPVSIVGSTVLGVLAASVQNVSVVKKTNWGGYQNLSLFILCICESAGGKTRGMQPVTQAFTRLQADRQMEVDEKRTGGATLVRKLQKDFDKRFEDIDLSNELLAKLNGDEECDVLKEARMLQQGIDDLADPSGGSVLVYDHTVEATLQQMTKTDERAASLCGESRFVDQALGLAYQTPGSPSLIINAWDGETITNRRISRGSLVLLHPAMTICNGIQPDLFRKKYLKNPAFGDSGLMQRFLMVQPKGMFRVNVEDGDIDEALQAHWDQRILELASLDVPYEANEVCKSKKRIMPDVVSISREGNESLVNLEVRIGSILDAGVNTQHPRWRSWLGRLVGQVVRIAGLLHVYKFGTGFVNEEISGESVDQAIRLGTFYMSEVDRILNGYSVNEPIENARVIQDYIRAQRLKGPFIVQDLRNRLRRRIPDDEKKSTTQKIREALLQLRDDGVIREDTESGRQNVWVANPQLWGKSP